MQDGENDGDVELGLLAVLVVVHGRVDVLVGVGLLLLDVLLGDLAPDVLAVGRAGVGPDGAGLLAVVDRDADKAALGVPEARELRRDGVGGGGVL